MIGLSCVAQQGDSRLHVLAEFASTSWAHTEEVHRMTTSGECGDDSTRNKQHQHYAQAQWNRSWGAWKVL